MEPQPQPSPPVRIRPEPTPARPGAIALAAVLTELVIIAAVGNQWITKRAFQWILNENRSAFARDLKSALVVYNWRFAPQSGDTDHIWLSQLTLILVTLVLTAAFIAVVIRGPASFGRMFLTCWLASLGATILATYLRALVNDQPIIPGSRIQKAVFGPLAPSSISVFAALALSLAAGLVAAFVGRTVSRRVPPPVPAGSTSTEPPYVPPEQPPPYNPILRPGPGGSAGAPATFPRPPDEDDLGHDVYHA